MKSFLLLPSIIIFGIFASAMAEAKSVSESNFEEDGASIVNSLKSLREQYELNKTQKVRI